MREICFFFAAFVASLISETHVNCGAQKRQGITWYSISLTQYKVIQT